MLHSRDYLLAVDLETVGIIIFVVISALGRLLTEFAKGRGQNRPAAPQPPRAAPLPGAGPQGAPAQDQLRREVEEFLRKARGEAPRRGEPQREQPKPARPQQRPQQLPQPQGQQPRRPAARGDSGQRPRTPAQQPAQRPAQQPPRRAVDMEAEPMRRESVGDHVRSHIGGDVRSLEQHAATLSQHAAGLGADVGLADERMEEHLRERFTHQLGSLGSTVETTASPATARGTAASPMAQELVAMLSRPAGVRQLIIASEVLRRPEERWQRDR